MASGINPRDGNEEKENLLNIIGNGHVAKQKPHVLMMPYPGQGHVNPLMDLAKKLASQGVTITFVSSQFIHDRLVETQEVVERIALGHDVMPKKRDGDDDDDDDGSHEHVVDLELCVLGGGHGDDDDDAPIRMMGIPDGVAPHDHIVHDVAKHCEALLHHMPSRLLHAVTCLLQPPVTCVVADVYALVCTQPVAARLSVPHVAFWTQSAASYLTQMLVVQDPANYKELMVTNGEVDESYPTITSIPGTPPLKRYEIHSFLQSFDPSNFLFSFVLRCFTLSVQCSHILLNTYDTLEVESLDFIRTRANVLSIGPLLPSPYLDTSQSGSSHINELRNHDKKLEASSMWVENDSCLSWLDAQDPHSVIYISFGSISFISDQNQIVKFVAALEESGYPILMVVRDTKIFVENDVLVHEIIKSMKRDNVMITKWAPQLKVLGHPAIGGFLTHCGWNSTFEAICKGVPMLCWPFAGDQMLNCRCIVDSWNIGLEFQKDKASGLVNQEEIEAKVKCLMDPSSSKNIHEKAHKLSLMAKEAYHGVSKDNLDLFVNFLHK